VPASTLRDSSRNKDRMLGSVVELEKPASVTYALVFRKG
jgi:hypothetical protein